MFFLAALLLSSISFMAAAGTAKEEGTSSRMHRRLAHTQILRSRNNVKTYVLKDMYQGQSFLNDWDFFSKEDPTHGNVNFLSKSAATSKGLAYVQADGTTVLAVDDKTVIPVGGKRDSVRISTKKNYNGGLFIADFWAMPHGCSVWPAYWSVGPDWPRGGEIDILEGVHEQPTNQYTVHSSAGCTLSTASKKISGQIINKQCASSGSNNSGCAFIDGDTRTYGKAFNKGAGGVFVHLWDNTGITVWHFPRTAIPADITAKKPNPSQWGPPAAFWSPSTCDMASHFYEHALVLDTTICGDWAGPTHASAGCRGTCAQTVADPKNYIWAKWKLNYIAVYQ